VSGFRFDSDEKTLRSPFEGLRTNGGAVEIVGDCPFMLSIVEAFLGFSAEAGVRRINHG
jgi:hypothetical protein